MWKRTASSAAPFHVAVKSTVSTIDVTLQSVTSHKLSKFRGDPPAASGDLFACQVVEERKANELPLNVATFST